MCHPVFSSCFSVHGGELFERIVAEEYLMEDDAVDYVRQILEALKFMHERHIVHLDLKVTSTSLSVLAIRLYQDKKKNDNSYGSREYITIE